MKKAKIFSLILACILVVSVLSACGGNSASNNEPSAPAQGSEQPADSGEPTDATEGQTGLTGGPYKVAVATIHEGETWEIQKRYYEDVLAPTYNMEFMFSEKLEDANGLIDFMEKAYAAGCEGIINFQTSNDAISQGARRAEEWGMYFVTQNSRVTEDVADLPHNIGHCGADPIAYSVAYKEGFESLLDDGEPHSVFIFSGAAVGGAIGQGAASHYYSVMGMLEAMQEKYNLTFSQSIDDIINNQNPGEVETGNPDVKIYLYPGLDVQAATTALQTQLQTGDYDTFAAVFSYAAFTTAIDEVEKSLNKNVRIIGTAQIEQQTATGFETKDSTGDSILNVAILAPLNAASGVNCAMLYNGLTGHGEAMKVNGVAQLFGVGAWVCKDAETYAGVASLDKELGKYVMDVQDVLEITCEANPDVNYDSIYAKLTEISDVQNVINAKLK